MSDSTQKPTKNWLLAGLLAWILPGAGHFYLGRKTRGIILFISLSLAFWSGIAIGGVMTADKVYEPMWTYSQNLIGSYGGLCWYRQDKVYKEIAAEPDIKELFRQGSLQHKVIIHPSKSGRPDELQMRVDKELAKRNIAAVYPGASIARAYAGVAGLLNLLCIFDAIILAMMNAKPDPDEKTQSAEPGKSSTTKDESAE